jgi:hypothetical protein
MKQVRARYSKEFKIQDNASTDTMKIRNTFTAFPSSYYFIDEISVEEVLAANAGTDTSIVSGDSVQLGNNPTENATYLWQPAAGLSVIHKASENNRHERQTETF